MITDNTYNWFHTAIELRRTEEAALAEPEEPLERNHNSPWQNLLALLILGYMRHVRPRSEYTQLHMIFSLANLDLPHWNGLRTSRLRICKLLKMEIDLKDSVLHNSCYVINLNQIVAQALADPFVNQHLDFYPEYTGGKNVFKMSQCFKLREDLSPDLRVQMVEENEKHWYIFEPVELKSRHIVVPIFFFIESNQVKAQFILANISKDGPNEVTLSIPSNLRFNLSQLRTLNITDSSLSYQEIQLPGSGSLIETCGHELHETNNSTKIYPVPNSWRTKARGRLIQHVPINLYS
ncbi:hypothetical protein VP01_507g4, partial [Puccinia sorghi]